MTESLRQFMAGIIDYAGLFPPAGLPINVSLHNYADYRKDADSWMLSRFILPVALFNEAGELAKELTTAGQPFAFSVLPQKTETIDAFRNEIATSIKACIAFCHSHPELVITDMMEIKLPEEAIICKEVGLLKQLLDETANKLNESALSPSQIFYEGGFGSHWESNNEAIIQAISEHNKSYKPTENYQFAAYKIRCGGVTADVFPAIEQVAFILHCAQQYGVAIKGTAGLHHPVRHYAKEVETKMHGFFNVFGGAILAHANKLPVDVLGKILDEENPEAFHFTDAAFSWNGYSASTEEIENLRQNFVLSYGSCSFDDPREDLAQLKLL